MPYAIEICLKNKLRLVFVLCRFKFKKMSGKDILTKVKYKLLNVY